MEWIQQIFYYYMNNKKEQAINKSCNTKLKKYLFLYTDHSILV